MGNDLAYHGIIEAGYFVTGSHMGIQPYFPGPFAEGRIKSTNNSRANSGAIWCRLSAVDRPAGPEPTIMILRFSIRPDLFVLI